MVSLSHSRSHGIISDGKKVTVRLFGVNIAEESMQNNSESQNSKKQKRRPFHQWKERNPWTEEEHRNFLAGLKWVGKGKWTEISQRFVPTKTPTQIASHAQKHFLRQSRLASAVNIPISPSSFAVEALKFQTLGFVSNIQSIITA